MAGTKYHLDDEGRKAVEKVIEQGFALPDRPPDQPTLPTDLDDLSNSDLMEEFRLFTAWADYANAQAGLAVIAERQAELDVEWHISNHFGGVSHRKSVTILKAEILQNPDVYAARKRQEAAFAYRRVVSDLAVQYERDASVLSRELTRRSLDAGPKASRRDRWES